MLAVIHLNDDTDGIYSFAMVNLKFKVDSMCVEDFSIVVVWAMNHNNRQVSLVSIENYGEISLMVSGDTENYPTEIDMLQVDASEG